MTKALIAVAMTLSLSACHGQSSGAGTAGTSSTLERGRYLTLLGGCNDCHTSGYRLKFGEVDEKDWLMGDSLGWQGPWGTTYPANLRLYFDRTSEADWLKAARNMKMRPPMPWYSLRAMTDGDLRAIYKFIHSLGPAGAPAPAYLTPDTLAPAPKFVLVLPSAAAAAPASTAPGQ